MNPFEAWNLRLLQNYFPTGSGGQEVFLGTSPEELDRLGADLGGDAGLLACIQEGPSWPLPDSFVERVRCLTEQRTRTARRGPRYVDPRQHDASYTPGSDVRRSAPAYLPYLAALARTAAVANSAGYYAKLRADFQLPDNWGSTQMSRIVGTWDDLAAWTASTQGEYGKFIARQLGSHRLIGLPKSQVIMSATDIPAIHLLFKDFGVQEGLKLNKDQLEMLLTEMRSGERRLSSALAQASLDPAYSTELKAILADIHQGWDGTAQPSAPYLRPNGQDGGDDDTRFGIYLDGALPWRPQVQLDVSKVGDGDDLEAGDGWRLTRRGDRGLVATLNDDNIVEFLSRETWSLGVSGETHTLPRRGLWVLRRSLHGSLHELWEGELSPYGNTYLLADDARVVALAEYLERTSPKYREVPTDGLPRGWRLVWLEDQDLSDEQLALPGGDRTRARIFRLEGGTAVSHDGSRHYLYYDLPRVVVMAPKGAFVECEGTRLQPSEALGAGELRVEGVQDSSHDPYFDLPDELEAGGKFSLRVFNAEGEELGTGLTIRVKNPDGLPQPKGCTAGAIDRFGNPTFADEGLRGGFTRDSSALLSAGVTSLEEPLHVTHDDFLDDRAAASWQGNPSVLFLDALAASVRMSYSKAARLLERLVAGAGAGIEPWRLLDHLWTRGHVELERTNGATAYVHAVPPAVYELPIHVDSTKTFGVLGSLSIAHWKAIQGRQLAWRASIGLPCSKDEPECMLYPPVVRLRSLVGDPDLASRLWQVAFGMLPVQGVPMAKWSASLPEVYAGITSRTSLDPPIPNPTGAMLFDPVSGFFRRIRGGLTRPERGAHEVLLYRCDDPIVRGRKLHVLAHSRGFASVQDMRWGKWVAVMMSQPAKAGSRRSPLTTGDGDHLRRVWIPSRLRPPPVLERALVLCSGAPPDEHRMDAGFEDKGRMELVLDQSRQELGIHVDSALLGGMAQGKWLAYSGVPASVANIVRNKLRRA